MNTTREYDRQLNQEYNIRRYMALGHTLQNAERMIEHDELDAKLEMLCNPNRVRWATTRASRKRTM